LEETTAVSRGFDAARRPAPKARHSTAVPPGRTKAETLAALRGRLATAVVPDLLYFTVSEWRSDCSGILSGILAKFAGRAVAVRSSSFSEDGKESSLAGHFRSCLAVKCEASQLARAIDAVSSSMRDDPGGQIVVQEFVGDVRASGVVFTRHPGTGAPYYILEYDDETGATDIVTSGRRSCKREIIAQVALGHLTLSETAEKVVALTRELEDLLAQQPLDIEFAITRAGLPVLLQVRRLLACPSKRISVLRHSILLERLASQIAEFSKPAQGVAGSRTVLGQMPDWNPAELLGPHPRPLAVSLFQALIGQSTWRVARAGMGYREVVAQPLIRLLAGRPFVDVRNSFNSLLPAGVSLLTEELLADAWMSRLCSHPHLHDKVEFEIAQTVCDFCFEANHRSWYPGLLGPGAYQEYRRRLIDLTRRNVRLDGSLARSLRRVLTLERRAQEAARVHTISLGRLRLLLRQCHDLGSLPFAVTARHAFIAEALLRSLVGRGAWEPARLSAFRNTLHSLAREVVKALAEVRAGRLSVDRFNCRFGHLRPSSFDIRSCRYDRSPELFEGDPQAGVLLEHTSEEFALSSSERRSIDQLSREAGLALDADELLEYCRAAIQGREYAKFVFSRNLSDALELIARRGEKSGFSRDDLSFLPLESLTGGTNRQQVEQVDQRRREYRDDETVRLPQLIIGSQDVYRIVEGDTVPNFVTTLRTEGSPACVAPGDTISPPALQGKIVLIESADPGFDWIFSERIEGLITKYGGSNSHMAIRCAEMSLPAAIGVGEHLFEALALSPRIELSCGEGTVRGVYV